MSATISALVPTYQRSGFLAEALEALIGQTRSLHQIIVWDDGSTDATPEVARAAMAAAPGRVSSHRDANGGKSRALNRAMAHATGDYIWVCDDDDLALPDAAARLGSVLDTTDADLSGGPHLRFSEPQGGAGRTVVDAGYWPDLERGSVMFLHDGTETLSASFDVVVADKAGATSGAAQTVKVAVRGHA